MRPLQELQIGEDVAEMLRVASAAPATLHERCGWRAQHRFAQDGLKPRLPGLTQRARIRRNAGPGKTSLDLICLEQFPGICPKLVESGLSARVAFIRAVAEADKPFAGMAQVISGFLFGFGCDRGER